MFHFLAFVGLTICIGGIAWCSWMLHQNNKTANDRGVLLDAIYHDSRSYDEKKRLSKMYEKVSYDDHIWARSFCRDWRTLYDPELIAALEEYLDWSHV